MPSHLFDQDFTYSLRVSSRSPLNYYYRWHNHFRTTPIKKLLSEMDSRTQQRKWSQVNNVHLCVHNKIGEQHKEITNSTYYSIHRNYWQMNNEWDNFVWSYRISHSVPFDRLLKTCIVENFSFHSGSGIREKMKNSGQIIWYANIDLFFFWLIFGRQCR